MVIAQNEIFRTVVENGKYGDPVDTMKSSPRSSDALQASDGSWVSIRTAFTQEQVTVQEYTRVQITFFVIYTDQMATNIDQMLDFIGEAYPIIAEFHNQRLLSTRSKFKIFWNGIIQSTCGSLIQNYRYCGRYCGRECQVAVWKAHKNACDILIGKAEKWTSSNPDADLHSS